MPLFAPGPPLLGGAPSFALRSPPCPPRPTAEKQLDAKGKAVKVNARDGVTYSKWKAFVSAFGSSSYGGDAKLRAATYRRHSGTSGGPPAASGAGHKHMFCSMLASACCQPYRGDEQRGRNSQPQPIFARPHPRPGFPLDCGGSRARFPPPVPAPAARFARRRPGRVVGSRGQGNRVP